MKLKIIFATSQSFESKEVKARSTYFEQKNTTNEIYKFKKKYVPKIYRLDMDFNLTDKRFLPLVCDAKACYYPISVTLKSM